MKIWIKFKNLHTLLDTPLDEAIKTRINEIIINLNISLTALCLNSNITPSTITDFMYGKTKHPNIYTIKKLCAGASLTLSQFFDREYFNDTQ